MTLSDINTILNATEEIHRLRAELAERDAEIARLKEDVREWRNEHESVAQHLAATRVHLAEKPRTDAEWKAADRKKRINDLAARYAGQLAFSCDLYHPDQTPLRIYRGIVKHARALATEIVEAEE